MTTSITQTPPTEPAWEPRWAPGRVIAFALAVFLLLGAAASFGGAAWLSGVDDDHRVGGYLTADPADLRTSGHALAIEEIDLDGLSGDWVLGDARLRATGADPADAVFVGIARSDDAADYLRGVEHAVVSDIDDGEARYEEHAGGALATAPTDTDIWVAEASGPGTQTVRWTPEDGDWTVVVMNADGAGGVDVRADVGATVPLLEHVTTGLRIVGASLGVLGAALLAGLLVRPARRGQ